MTSTGAGLLCGVVMKYELVGNNDHVRLPAGAYKARVVDHGGVNGSAVLATAEGALCVLAAGGKRNSGTIFRLAADRDVAVALSQGCCATVEIEAL
jgi:hypothetical protein